MKKLNLFNCLLFLVVVCFFSSCSSTKYAAHFQSSGYQPYAYEKADKGEEVLLVQQQERLENHLEETSVRAGAEDIQTDALPVVTSIKQHTLLKNGIPEMEEWEIRRQEMKEMVKERLRNMSRKEKRALKRELKKIRLADYTKDLPTYRNMDVQDLQQEDVNLVALILAIFIPPLGVYIHQGEINNKFWISLVLTLLFFVPGQIYSVLVVLGVVD